MPALFTQISIGPNCFSIWSAACSTAGRSETSKAQVPTRPLQRAISAAISCAACKRISVTATAAPSSAKARQIAAPIPLPPPVMTATLLLSLIFHTQFASFISVLHSPRGLS